MTTPSPDITRTPNITRTPDITRTPNITLGGWFSARAARAPQRPALTFEGVTRSYRELLERVDRLASALRGGGVGSGDRVAFLGFNHPALLETWLATSRIGAVFLPLNFRLAAPELEFIIGDAQVHTLIVLADQQPVIDSLRNQVPVRRWVGVEAAAAPWQDYETLIADTPPLSQPSPSGADDVALLMYTSGTTGAPKGVQLTHANLWWNLVNLMLLYDVLEDDVTLAIAPLFHIAGLNVTIPTTWLKGGHVVLHRSFDAEATVRAIEEQRVSTMFAVPAMLNTMSQLPGFDDADLSSLRVVICGGAPVPAALLARYAQRGVGILQGYGLTETAPAAIFLVAQHAASKLGSAGQPPMFVEAKLIDSHGATISAAGERGEICLRGPNVTQGYWQRPDATASAIDGDGWLHTEDVGERDADGFYFVVDRIKDMVITGGENVYPAEVENVLYEHPAVAEVAVIGLPDPRWGEAVVAVVSLRPGAKLTLDDVRSFATASLARYKLPQRLEIVAELPRNSAGKVLKAQLRRQIEQRSAS